MEIDLTLKNIPVAEVYLAQLENRRIKEENKRKIEARRQEEKIERARLRKIQKELDDLKIKPKIIRKRKVKIKKRRLKIKKVKPRKIIYAKKPKVEEGFAREFKKVSKSSFYPYEKARELVRIEQLNSRNQYHEWFTENKPFGLAKRPDRIYDGKGWISWNDYLGTNNIVGVSRGSTKRFTYEEAKKWVKPYNLKNAFEWYEFKATNPINPMMPNSPDIYYKSKNRGWISWKNFLGIDFENNILEIINKIPILYVMKKPNLPTNVYSINIVPEIQALDNFIKQGFTIGAIYEFGNHVNLREILAKFGSPYTYGANDDFIINGSIHALLAELDYSYRRIKK